MTLLDLQLVARDAEIQPRGWLDEAIIAEYAEDMRIGAQFPPVVVFRDGATYWLADGFHRARAAEAAGRTAIPAEIREGTRRDALLYSAGCNAGHGLRRTTADKRYVVERLLRDPEWGRWSDREIGRRCAVSHELVREVRATICQPLTDAPSARTVGRGGTTYVMETARIGRRVIPAPASNAPNEMRAEPENLRDEAQRPVSLTSEEPHEPAEARPAEHPPHARRGAWPRTVAEYQSSQRAQRRGVARRPAAELCEVGYPATKPLRALMERYPDPRDVVETLRDGAEREVCFRLGDLGGWLINLALLARQRQT